MKNLRHNKCNAILKTISFPIVVFIIINILTLSLIKTPLIATSADVRSIFRTIIMMLCFSLALNSNFALGRMDMSIGSQMYLGCILGGNLALNLQLGGVGVLVFSIVAGALAGALVGFVYIKLRILPMILGLGMALIYECFSFAIFNQNGLILYGKSGVSILSSTWFIALCAVIVICIITFLFQNSLFGYRRRAIAGNQQLSSNFGINIYTNCVGCYLLGGALAAFAGVFLAAYNGTLSPVLDLGTKSVVFGYMFPMMVGVWLGSICSNSAFGTLCAAMSICFLQFGIAKFGLDANIQSLIISLLWLLFMVYRFNWPKIHYAVEKKQRRKEALQYKKEVLGL